MAICLHVDEGLGRGGGRGCSEVVGGGGVQF